MKDYAKRPQPQKQHSNNGNSLLLFCLLCAIFFLAFVTYHFFHKPALLEKTAQTQPVSIVIKKPKETRVHQTRLKKVTVAAKKDVPAVVDNQPKYDFYKLLSKMTVVIPLDDESSNQLPSTIPAKQKKE